MGMPVHFASKKAEKLKEPGAFNVVLLNDNYTTMDFVVDILIGIFNKSSIEAERIMMNIHRKGRGVAGAYSFDIARTKAAQVHALAGQYDFPLRCEVEPV
ncbi:MAG: ATP-dependent Clp protease adaptor ClpS [Spirochaetaceae bacterium]|jgi:ATP-dependent Clp protease adaptor protein ClpS|nr:ATP-dependent Clp protease adaptor ClpS [Spirochaetaceae bacterium]